MLQLPKLKQKRYKTTLKKLNSLLEDKDKQIVGAKYSSSLAATNFLTRPQTRYEVDVTENKVKLFNTVRVNRVGMLELEGILDRMVTFEAGDLPGYSPEATLPEGKENIDRPQEPDTLITNDPLYSMDVVSVYTDPEVLLQDFTIAGHKYTLVTVMQAYGDDKAFEQGVSLLFTTKPKDSVLLSLYSPLVLKELSVPDTQKLMEISFLNNMTGRVTLSGRLYTERATAGVYPYNHQMDVYLNASSDLIVGTPEGYLMLPREDYTKSRAVVESKRLGGYTVEVATRGALLFLSVEP